MARYNTVNTATTSSGTATFSTPTQGLLTTLTGAAPYTVTLAMPAMFTGITQSFFNNTGGVVTLTTPSGNILGAGFTGATSQTIPANATYTLTSDGTNYVIVNNEGGPISATTLSASSTVTLSPTSAGISINPANGNVTISPTGTGTVTMSPATAGNINNIAIGGTTRGAGSFTTLAANNAVTMTRNGQGTTTTDAAHTLVITGGVGISGTIYSATFNGPLTGNVTGNVSGSSASCTGTSVNATNITTTGAVTTAGTFFPTFVASNGSSNQGANTATAFTFAPSTGTLTSTIVTASSDARLKENVKPITNALALVNRLEGVRFNRIGQTREEIGVIAQQVEEVVPQLVFTDEEGMKSVAYANAVGLLIEAIKAQQLEIEELKKRIV